MATFREVYENMSDEEIRRFAVNEAKDLRPEAFTVFMEEIRMRNIDENIISNAFAQRSEMTDEEIEELALKYSATTCPLCHKNRFINGIAVKRIIGIILFVVTNTEFVIGCKKCIREKVANANTSSMRCGWWAFPLGLLLTPGTIMGNNQRLQEVEQNQLTDDFVSFVEENRGLVLNIVNSSK